MCFQVYKQSPASLFMVERERGQRVQLNSSAPSVDSMYSGHLDSLSFLLQVFACYSIHFLSVININDK